MAIIRKFGWLAGTAILLTTQAFAQEAATAPAEDEIVVTAQKRAQSLQDVPMSIAAIGGDAISRQAQVRLDEATTSVPNLKITEGFTGNTLNIRGIGTGQGNAGLEQSVAMFSDGVYIGRSRMSIAPLADVERIEILRGPQPVYFGQNAVAGALSIATRDGKGPFAFNGSASYGNQNEYTVDAGLTLPIVKDVIGLRVAGRYTDRDGYVTNIFTGQDQAGLQTSLFRATLSITPSSALNIRLKYERGYSEQDGVPAETVNCGVGGRVPGAPPFIPCLLASAAPPAGFGVGQAFLPQPNRIVAEGGVVNIAGATVTGEAFARAPDETRTNLWSGQLDYDFGAATLTAITAYGKYGYQGRRDLDGTPYAVIHPILREDYKQFSQEIRLTSNEGLFGGLIDYLIGGYYQDATINTANKTFSTTGPTASGTTYESKEKYLTGFVGLTFNATDALRFNLGGRYSDVKKDAVSFAIYAPQTLAVGSDAVFATHASVAGNLTCAAGVVRANSDANPATLESQCLRGSRDTSNFDYQAGVQYDVADDVMLFATFSNAFKAGGFVQSGTNLPAGPTDALALAAFSYGDESANSFEFGFKGRFFDRQLRLNATAFQTKYKNLQVTSFDVVAQTFLTQNAAAATSKGIEFDGDLKITNNIRFEFSGSVLDASYDRFPGAQCSQFEQSLNQNGCTFDRDRDGLLFGIAPGEPASDIVAITDRAGYKLLFAPNWTLNLGVNMDFPIGGGMRAGFNGNVNFTDDYQVSDRYDPRGLVEGFERINARIEIGAENGRWTLAAYGNNLTNQQPLITFGPSQLGGQQAGFAVSSRGKSYGLQFRWKFGN
ncbi:MAG: hypothetical protein RLZZ331_542 [Pseudomonadota bacterium]|jgi:outer membrane receptor protein involved in Fe transport